MSNFSQMNRMPISPMGNPTMPMSAPKSVNTSPQILPGAIGYQASASKINSTKFFKGQVSPFKADPGSGFKSPGSVKNMNSSPYTRNSGHASVKLAPIIPAEGHSQHTHNVGGHLAQPRGSAHIAGSPAKKL